MGAATRSALFADCIVCRLKFRQGPRTGRYVTSWNAYVCADCENTHADGVPAGGFVSRLRRRGVTPLFNDAGRVEIPLR
jgi:hypothetical protein